MMGGNLELQDGVNPFSPKLFLPEYFLIEAGNAAKTPGVHI